MKKHIIFDFDDTISSAYEHNQQLFVDTFLPYKSDIDQDYVRKVHFVGRGTSMNLQFEEVINKFGLNVTVEQLVNENELIHQEKAADVKLYDGFEDVLKHFKKMGKIISLCTNRAEISCRMILEKNNLIAYFDNVISCKEAAHEKPDPFCLLELIKKYPHIDKKDLIYFGDSKTDADFASSAGIDYLVIDHHLNRKQFYNVILNSFAGGEDELLVEVDKHDKEIGSIYKMEAYTNASRYHRSVHVVIFNSSGRLVLQKRSDTKMYMPGIWDIVGGFHSYGHTIEETANVEVTEEMGVKPILKYFKKWFRPDQGVFYYVYYTVNDGPYVLDDHEVSDVKEFDCQKLLNHEYDSEFKILEHVYKYVEELKAVWTNLQSHLS